MGKKHKNPENNTTANNVQESNSSSIFQTLFGNLDEHQNPVSIFSDQNPFRRKPTREQPQLPRQLENQGEADGEKNDLYIASGSRERKRKKDKEKPELGSSPGDEIVEEITPRVKKSKKGKSKGNDLSAQLEKLDVKNDNEEPNLGIEPSQRVVESKKEKKRKRDELESEYETKRYGGEEGEVERKVVGEKRKKADDPIDVMTVSKEGFDDEAKLLRTVFVGNLPVKIKKKALFSDFKQYGEVESVRIRSVPILDSKKPRKGAVIMKKINEAVDSVHAYIVFKTEEAAQASLAHNMAVVGGNHIRVDRACPPRKKLKGEDASSPLYDNKRTVFVGNLPFDVKDEEVYQLFSGIKDLESTSIEAIRVIRDPGSSLGKGIAYILFKSRAAANIVARKHGLKLRDRELRLCHAKSNLTPSKRKYPSSEERVGPSRKKFALSSKTPESKLKVQSYQGLRATKSGVQKKIHHSKGTEPLNFNSKSKAQSGEKVKERKGKRPAVLARKAKAMKGGESGSKQTGFKRKMDSRTPEGSQARPNKKAKNFR